MEVNMNVFEWVLVLLKLLDYIILVHNGIGWIDKQLLKYGSTNLVRQEAILTGCW